MSISPIMELIDNAAVTGGAFDWPGGEGTFIVHADTWNGATVTLQYLSAKASTFVDVGTASTFTADGMAGFNVGPGSIRAEITVASPTGVYARVIRN